MRCERGELYTAFGHAFVLVSAAALTLVLTTSLLTRAGIPFAASYTVSIIACIVGTLAVSYRERTRIALPSPAIMSWLVYEEIIAHGLTWQETLGITFIAALLGAILTRTLYADILIRALPPAVRTGLVFGLALSMLVTSALYTRILLPSPWALTMGGTLSDPLTYFTVTGILLVLLLYARNMHAALPLGILLIALLTWAEGFWEIPTAPFFTPDIISLPFVLSLPQTDVLSAAGVGCVLLLGVTIENISVLGAEQSTTMPKKPLTRLFAVSAGGAAIGAFPLTIMPLSAVLPGGEERCIVGIPLTAGISVLLLAILLPCAPLMQAFMEFPAVPAIALAVTGLLLLVRALHLMKNIETFTIREGAVIAAFLLASYDIKTGLTAALLTWTLFTAARGERVPSMTWGLTALFTAFYLLKWII